jgi:hypothetical protein
MPQPLDLTGGGSGTLLVRHQMRTLLYACPGGVMLQVEQYYAYLANEVISAWK